MTFKQRERARRQRGWLEKDRQKQDDALYFDGQTYDEYHDQERLSTQLSAVQRLMADRRWRTLQAITLACGGSEAGISARLRDLRKVRNGGWTVERRRVEGESGLYEYRMLARVEEIRDERLSS